MRPQRTKVCHVCDEIIEDQESAVLVGHDLGNSGPGWSIYAHPEHAEEVVLVPDAVLRIMTGLWTAVER